MNVIVQGRNLDVPAPLRQYAERKIGKITKLFKDIQKAQVVLSVKRDGTLGRAQTVEVTVWGDGIMLRGEEATADMRASIDLVVEKLEKQLEKVRSRLIERRRSQESRRRARDHEAAVAELQAGVAPGAEAEPAIVRMKRFAMKPMTAEDAAVELELLGHDFYVFRNAQSGAVNVLYRRRDGNLGLIEPE